MEGGGGRKQPPPRESDPWSDETWRPNNHNNHHHNNGDRDVTAMNVTFDTVETDVFEFSAGESELNHRAGVDDGEVFRTPSDVEWSIFRGAKNNAKDNKKFVGDEDDDDDGRRRKNANGLPVVSVSVDEQLSAMYDDVSQEPTCHLEGAVHARSMVDMGQHPFCLVLRDLLGHIDVLEDRPAVSKDVSKEISRKGLHRGDRVVRISLPSTSKGKVLQIARYICHTELRPVPLVRLWFHRTVADIEPLIFFDTKYLICIDKIYVLILLFVCLFICLFVPFCFNVL